jgi:endo-1,4-beta-xylanase
MLKDGAFIPRKQVQLGICRFNCGIREKILKLRGHAQHNQTRGVAFTDAKGDTVSKEVLLQRLKDHITTLVTRYKCDLRMDVVNEAISDRPDEFIKLLVICGEDFIAKGV